MTEYPLTGPDPRHLYIQGQEDASIGMEIEERYPQMTEAEQRIYWAYKDGWRDWHNGHRS